MAIQNYHERLETERSFNVIDMPDVLERRHWLISWIKPLRYKRHKQFFCFREKDADKAFISPEFLRRVGGTRSIRKMQCDRVWEGIPEIEKAKPYSKAPEGETRQERIDRLKKKHGRA